MAPTASEGAPAPASPVARGWSIAIAALVTALSVLFYVIAFPPLDLPEAAYFWALPFLIWIYLARPSWKATLVVAGVAQWVSWLVLLRWLRHFPEQTGIEFAGLLGWICLLLLALIVACFGVAWLLAARWVLPRCVRAPLAYRLSAMIGLAAGWVVLEWIRSSLFTGFPWLLLAASQWQRPLIIQVAAFTGAWGVSFVLILFNLGLVFYLRTFLETRRAPWWKRFSPEFYLALIALFAAIAVNFMDTRQGVPQPAFSAGFVQPAVMPRERWNMDMIEEVLEDYKLVAQYASFDGADAILWPEASTPLPAERLRRAVAGGPFG